MTEEGTCSGPLGLGLGQWGQDGQCVGLSASLSRGTLAVGGRAVGRIWQGDGPPPLEGLTVAAWIVQQRWFAEWWPRDGSLSVGPDRLAMGRAGGIYTGLRG